MLPDSFKQSLISYYILKFKSIMKSFKSDYPGTAKELNPQHNTYNFGQIKISSDFDNGNIWDVFQVSERYYTMAIVGDGLPFNDSFPFK